ncbi:hypothetical protein G5I_03233 [Acromyrmex echinatior]|uniref:Uncharacterized protein n=1 Tax=Acromyrmex echinatior TaxID=103372 RepID=F4WCF8_ACREC|nr:hypothetical protein G5I_03233 [Acromyrmex echinatior]
MYSRAKRGVSHAGRIVIARSRSDNRFMTNVKETLCPKGSPHARNGSVTHERVARPYRLLEHDKKSLAPLLRLYKVGVIWGGKVPWHKEEVLPRATRANVFLSLILRKGMPRSIKVAPIRDKFDKCALDDDDDDEGIDSMTKIRCRICELLGENQGLNHGLSHPCHLTNLNHLRPGLNYSPLPNMNYLNHGLLNGLYLPQLKDMMLAAYLLRAGYRTTKGRSNPKRDLAPRTALNPHTIDQRPRNRIIQILTAAFYGSPPVFLVSPIFIAYRWIDTPAVSAEAAAAPLPRMCSFILKRDTDSPAPGNRARCRVSQRSQRAGSRSAYKGNNARFAPSEASPKRLRSRNLLVRNLQCLIDSSQQIARSIATHDCTGKENSPTTAIRYARITPRILRKNKYEKRHVEERESCYCFSTEIVGDEQRDEDDDGHEEDTFPQANKLFLARLDLPPVARNSICIFSCGF